MTGQPIFMGYCSRRRSWIPAESIRSSTIFIRYSAGGSVGSWNFGAASRGGQPEALAELGFIVVAIEGTSESIPVKKAFSDMSYGNMAVTPCPDQVAGIRQLAQRYPYIDTSRVGIWGHSGGGFATAGAMFRYPDFFKVGISESGNHDNRNYEDDWGERYDGADHEFRL